MNPRRKRPRRCPCPVPTGRPAPRSGRPRAPHPCLRPRRRRHTLAAVPASPIGGGRVLHGEWSIQQYGTENGLSQRALQRKYNVAWRTVRRALDGQWPEPRRRPRQRESRPAHTKASRRLSGGPGSHGHDVPGPPSPTGAPGERIRPDPRRGGRARPPTRARAVSPVQRARQDQGHRYVNTMISQVGSSEYTALPYAPASGRRSSSGFRTSVGTCARLRPSPPPRPNSPTPDRPCRAPTCRPCPLRVGSGARPGRHRTTQASLRHLAVQSRSSRPACPFRRGVRFRGDRPHIRPPGGSGLRRADDRGQRPFQGIRSGATSPVRGCRRGRVPPRRLPTARGRVRPVRRGRPHPAP